MLRGGQVTPTKKGKLPELPETKKKDEVKEEKKKEAEKEAALKKKPEAKDQFTKEVQPKPPLKTKPKNLDLFSEKKFDGLFEEGDLPPEPKENILADIPLDTAFEVDEYRDPISGLYPKDEGKKAKKPKEAKAAGPKPKAKKAKGPKGEKKAAGLESAAKGKPKIKGGTAKILYDPGMVKAVSKLSKEKQEAYINSQPSYLQPQIRAELKKLAGEG